MTELENVDIDELEGKYEIRGTKESKVCIVMLRKSNFTFTDNNPKNDSHYYNEDRIIIIRLNNRVYIVGFYGLHSLRPKKP